MKKKSASQSAFFKLRLLIAVLLCFGAITLVLFAQPRSSLRPSGQFTAHRSRPISWRDAGSEVRYLAAIAQHETAACERDVQSRERRGGSDSARTSRSGCAAIRLCSGCSAKSEYRIRSSALMEISNLCGGCAPPDPNGAVGPNHVVTMSNLHFQIFNKTGTSLFGPAANNTLWAGFGGGCQTQNAGDPVVLYDQLADRWLLTQFTSSRPAVLRMRGAFADQ